MNRQLRNASLIMRRAIERCNQHGVQIIDLQTADDLLADLDDESIMERLTVNGNDPIVVVVNNELRKKNAESKGVQSDRKSKVVSKRRSWRKLARSRKAQIKQRGHR